MHGNLHGYLPTKCEPGNVIVDFEIVVLMLSLYLLYTSQNYTLFINFVTLIVQSLYWLFATTRKK